MAKAGVQKMSLPQIYNMFKTASDEDKIKLMNTYSNLGERLGKRDQDLEYRRLMGDPEALEQRTATEGISDTLGGLWDYTKQGAETAWDYAKKGAKKGAESLRDLVMGEEQEELEELNAELTVAENERNATIESAQTSMEGYKPQSSMQGYNPEHQYNSRSPDESRMQMMEAEGNAFVGSKEDADIDPLAGGMSPDPNMSLFDAVNEPESEPESETLSPQEQRFLGESAPNKEVVESPFTKRLNERLAKIAEQNARTQKNPDLAWSSRYALDPERATFDYGREKDALHYASKNSAKPEAPEKIIRMLQTEINRTTRNRDKAIEDFGANSVQAQRYNNLLKELEIEMTSESPSVSNAYTRSGELPPPEASGLVGAEDIENMIKNASFSDLGLLEGRDEIASAIEKWRVENGVSVQDPTYKSMIKTLEDKEKSKDKQYTRTDAEQKEFDKLDEKYKKLYTYSRNTPEATWAKSQLLNIVLRDETGAAIASDEARDLALNMLPDDATRNDFISRWDNAISVAIGNMDSAKDAVKIAAAASGNLPWSEVAGLGSLLEEIKGKMSGKKLQEYARSSIPSSYLKAKDRENKGEKPKPNMTIPAGKVVGDEWSDDNYYYRLTKDGLEHKERS